MAQASSKQAPAMASVLLLIPFLFTVVSGAAAHTFRPRFPRMIQNSQPSLSYNYRTEYFTQEIDHFTFRPKSYNTFQQRYLINDEYWSGAAAAGPIFMYCGNEGYIDWFANNTGFMWDIAPEFEALLVFPEHRYYGESMPFGSAEESYANASTLAFLTAEQALADFSVLITDLKANLSAEASPVILFGGSYGGMLAAWLRLKYPHIAIGALASSAPILQFQDIVPEDTFYRIVSSDFKRESEDCFVTIRESWRAIEDAGKSGNGLAELSKRFRLCRPLNYSQELADWLSDAYANLAMVDYPIPANFLMPLPAFPIREVCKAIDSLPAGSDVLDRIFAGASVFYNYTGDAKCFLIGDDPHGENGWNYQACTEMVMPMSSNASNSMFPPFVWDEDAFASGCEEQFGVAPRDGWIPTQFGGKDISVALRDFGSNIIFSQGALDPWSGGGVLKDISDTLISIVIPDGAHHLDLRAATPDDPKSVRKQRRKEKRIFRRWLREYHRARRHHYRWMTHRCAVNALLLLLPLLLLAFAILLPMVAMATFSREAVRWRLRIGSALETNELLAKNNTYNAL